MSAYAQPIVVRGPAIQLVKRLSLSGGEGTFHEAWLQEKLFQHPDALPLKELAPNLQPVVAVCRELNTLAGPADILYVTATGQIVLVETKLWRNQEARRTVVAQILDYAKELAAWTYEDLAREVARATGKSSSHLLDVVKARFPDIEEDTFVDAINHNLRTGDMLLVIVGDGIRSGAEALIGFLERYATLRFSFGLVEVAVYDIGDGVFMQPRVLAKTELIRRSVTVAVNLAGVELPPAFIKEDVTEAAAEQDGLSDTQQFFTGFWSDFLSRLRLDDVRQPLPSKTPKGQNVFFPMPPSGASAWISGYLAKSMDKAGVYLTSAKTLGSAQDAFEYLQADKEAIEEAIGEPLVWEFSNGRLSVSHSRPLGDLEEPKNREAVMRYLLTMTNRFINALRPRLEAFYKGRATV